MVDFKITITFKFNVNYKVTIMYTIFNSTSFVLNIYLWIPLLIHFGALVLFVWKRQIIPQFQVWSRLIKLFCGYDRAHKLDLCWNQTYTPKTDYWLSNDSLPYWKKRRWKRRRKLCLKLRRKLYRKLCRINYIVIWERIR